MMPSARYFCIFINVGLGEAAKLPAISGSLSSSGWIKIPVIEGESFIIQWGRIGPSDSKTGVATGSYPIAFPNSAFMAFIAEKTAVSTGPIGINSWGVSELTKTELKAICAARTISTSAATETGDFLVLGY
ncbi:gp53-like domain-containing protein [Escherichia coli]|uniref:gp53-like domain-containing protein n=1 Tax=Escherichia coli TaxID=562 RepID=UPI001652C192